MIEQCKGKDLKNVAKSKLLQDGWHPSIKYDGNYIQIDKTGNEVRFFTSGNKEFYLPDVAESLVKCHIGLDFTIETEYIGKTDGKLGSRRDCSTGTWRANFKNNITSNSDGVKFKVFDCIRFKPTVDMLKTMLPKTTYKERLPFLMYLNLNDKWFDKVYNSKSFSLSNIKLKPFTDAGWEGLFLIHESHVYTPGARVNTAIKLKKRPTADLVCVDVLRGTGKYLDKIGSLVLESSQGIQVAVGSGLSDAERTKPFEYYIGKIVEIEYEQIIDTYIQPTFIGIRDDKVKGD